MIFDSAEWGVLVEKANKHLGHLQQWNLNITKNKNLTKNCWQKENEKIVSSNHPFNRRWEPCPIWQEQGHCYTKSWSVPCLAKQLLRRQQTHKNPLLDSFSATGLCMEPSCTCPFCTWSIWEHTSGQHQDGWLSNISQSFFASVNPKFTYTNRRNSFPASACILSVSLSWCRLPICIKLE